MYKQNIYKVLSNEMLVPLVYKMCIGGDTQYITKPGQFINISLDGKFLRRPISVCDYDEKTITKRWVRALFSFQKCSPAKCLIV